MASRTTLFAITHWLLTAATLVMLLGMLLMVLAEGALLVGLFNLDGNHLGIPAVIHDPDMPAAIMGITRDTIFAVAIPVVGILAIGALALALVFHLTAKIVETTILGDPFIGENAVRLNQIGWLLLAMEVVGWGMKLALDPVLQRLPRSTHFEFGFDLSPIGLLGILLVFVLAQIFRRGSEMRDELESTV
jgi:hypothetical protein